MVFSGCSVRDGNLYTKVKNVHTIKGYGYSAQMRSFRHVVNIAIKVMDEYIERLKTVYVDNNVEVQKIIDLKTDLKDHYYHKVNSGNHYFGIEAFNCAVMELKTGDIEVAAKLLISSINYTELIPY